MFINPDLVGQTNPIYNIPASNFRAGPILGSECTATPLQNALSIPITNSILPRASDLGISTEQIYYCLTSVPYVSSQAYSTSWTIQI